MATHSTPQDRLATIDFAAHNAEIRDLWESWSNFRPLRRVATIFGTNSRYFMFNAAANPAGVDFRRYSEDPDVMFDMQLAFQRWTRFNILQDTALGLPDEWLIAPDFQNYYEAAWFGCSIEYLDQQVPDTRPAFADCPERIMEHGLPDPFGGFFARAREYVEHFKARAAREEYLGRPVRATVPLTGTDGVMTVACNVFGPEFVCTAMIEEPERLDRLLSFITEATIRRMRAWRQWADIPIPQDFFGFADDSIALISVEMYRVHILPHHRRLCEAFAAPQGRRGIHLCGDATRHFRTLRDELSVVSFDTGFPVDFARLRRELGPRVRIQGGPHVEFLRTATPAAIAAETRRILSSGILEGGLFLLREGNNLAPYTPLENMEALYHAGRAWATRAE